MEQTMDPSEDTEHIYNGFLTIGEQKKDGTEISFKDKYRRFFVLRCLRKKLLTLSGYKNAKDFKTPHGNLHKNVEQIMLTKDSKIHSMHFPAKKHKQSNVLCIVKDKQIKYLEADTREDLDAWCEALNYIFISLGWKEGPPPLPPLPPLPPNGQNQHLPQTEIESNLESPKSTERLLSDHGPTLATGSDSSLYERPNSSNLTTHPCCTRIHVSLPGVSDPDIYVNVHNIQDKPSWLEETNLHHERLVSIRDIYANLPYELNHPEPPPSLPPRRINNKRSGTFSGAHHSPPSSPLQSPRHSGGLFEERQTRSPDAERAPKIGLTEAPISPLPRQYPHLFDDSAVSRKISLPQPLNFKQRRVGLVTPPVGLLLNASPPDSPVMLRKAGSYSDLSNRPLPSPVKGDVFDFNTLRWEITHTNGFPVVLQKTDLENTLALVRMNEYVWIAGWKSGRSAVSKTLHVGDQLRQINNQIVVDPVIAHTLFSTSASHEILLVIRRLPHAKVRQLRRSYVTESWGLEVDGNRIIQVSTCGPASEAKMTPRAQGAFSERLCDWIISEIDGEPVSLFSRKDEVMNRMISAGLEMTLVIQPDDFIKKLKADLQKVKFAHEFFVGSASLDSD